MQIVGRHSEIAAIDALLARARSGHGGALVLVGPEGVGKTRLADLATDRARTQDTDVARLSLVRDTPAAVLWTQLLREVRATRAGATKARTTKAGPNRLPPVTDGGEVDVAARAVMSSGRLLVVIDDVDRGGLPAEELVVALASRASSGAVAVLATTSRTTGLIGELGVSSLTEKQVGVVVHEARPDVARALWLASQGNPGRALDLARRLPQRGDPVVGLALRAPSSSGFLDPDPSFITLMEEAALRTAADADHARVLARLACELVGDASAAGRRDALIEQASDVAKRSGQPLVVAEVLDARLHALWNADTDAQRLDQADEIMVQARRGGDAALERKGLFWRFVALMEQGRVNDAESALATYARAAALAGDQAGLVMVTARHAMLAILRGRFDDADDLVTQVAEQGRRIGLADTESLVGTLRGSIAQYCGELEATLIGVDVLRAAARRLPGHYYEATTARILLGLGRFEEAGLELDRVIERALAGSGPRWLGAMADLAVVAAATDRQPAAGTLRAAILPYDGRMVVFAGANNVSGPVARYLGVLEIPLGLLDEAVGHLDAAVELEHRIGALPGMAVSLVALADALRARGTGDDAERAVECRARAQAIADQLGMRPLAMDDGPDHGAWTLTQERDTGDWQLVAGDERARLRDRLGLRYLRALLVAPGREIAALDLAAGGPGLAMASSSEPVLDATARADFRRRLAVLDAELDAADAAGDPGRAARAGAERDAIVDALRRATGLGGRPRRTSNEEERARVNVTRAVRATVRAITAVAPQCGTHLESAVRTGRTCRYQPPAGAPPRWRV